MAENIAIKNGGHETSWKKIAEGTGTVTFNASNYDEICLIAIWSRNAELKVALNLPAIAIPDSGISGYIFGKNDHSIRIDVVSTGATITNWDFGSTNWGSSSTLICYAK